MTTNDNVADTWTIVVAAGSGSRFGGPKQFLDLGGERVVDRSVRIAAAHSAGVVVVISAEAFDGAEPGWLDPDLPARVIVVVGTDSRSGSVREGLAAVPLDATVILVHDGVRPLATDEIYERVLLAVSDGADAVVPVVPVTDTIRQRSGGLVDRAELVAIQTPQGFRAEALRAAHATGGDATDDATLVEAGGGRVVLVDGDCDNMKITDPSDLEIARLLLARREETP